MRNFYIQPEDWVPVGVDVLEPNAYEVVRSDINCSVIAGPGAGKTELLAQRSCYLLQTGLCPHPYRILAISFKRDAANNLKNRVAERCSKEDALRFDSLTFDAFAKSMLDRFMGALPSIWRPTKDYEIYMPKYSELKDFLDRFSVDPANARFRDQLLRIDRNTFEKDSILGSPLPPEGLQEKNPSYLAAKKWWLDCLYTGAKSTLTFPMIGRLVELLLRTNPKICKVLRATYSHVFMDEFQDTTHVQYDLVKTAFLNSKSVLTAVGDNKQQIMRWAMALDDAFSTFEQDFNATQIQLFSNYRSSHQLVEIQHYLARTIDAKYEQVESKISCTISEEACVIWDFKTLEAEAEYLAKSISSSILNYQLIPQDFAIIVKQKAKDYEPRLAQVFQQYRLKVRVTTTEDIIDKPLTEIVVAFLRLCSRESDSEHWSKCCKIITNLHGLDPTDERSGRKVREKLDRFHYYLGNKMNNPSSSNQISQILADIENFIGKDYIKLASPEYQNINEYEKILEQITNQIKKSYETVNELNWNSILDDFEGCDSVPIMTIHKSKGLQYHTVIFVGLDDSAWWSFQKQPHESRCNFFVAFSRAKQRVIFTYCKKRSQTKITRDKISSLYELLHNAGVKTEAIPG